MRIRKRLFSNQIADKKKIISTALSIVIVLMLIFSGPVRAVTLGIEIENQEIESGQVVEITAKMDLHSEDIIPDQGNFTITIEGGGSTYTCIFDRDGNNLSQCENFDITSPGHNLIYHDTNTSLQGYGYGYGEEYSTEETFFGYGYGYGYSYGYGYDDYTTQLKDSAEFIFHINWTSPDVEEETEFSVSFEFNTSSDTNDFTYTTLLENEGSFTVSPEEEEEGGTMYKPIVAPSKTTYEEKIGKLTEGLTLQIKNKVKDACNQMKGIVENAKESSVFTDTSQFQEQINNMGLENVEAVIISIMGEEEIPPAELSEQVRSQLSDRELSAVSNVKRNVKVTTFIKEDGTSVSLVEISYEIDMGDYIVEIPKSVAGSASEIQGNFYVLVDDPVLLFSNTDKIEFGVESKTNEVENITEESNNIAIAKAEEKQEETAQPEEEQQQTTEPEEERKEEGKKDIGKSKEKGSLTWLWILVIATVIAIVLAIIYKKRKK